VAFDPSKILEIIHSKTEGDYIKRKVCKSCVNSAIQNRKTIVAQALLAFPYDIPVADE